MSRKALRILRNCTSLDCRLLAKSIKSIDIEEAMEFLSLLQDDEIPIFLYNHISVSLYSFSIRLTLEHIARNRPRTVWKTTFSNPLICEKIAHLLGLQFRIMDVMYPTILPLMLQIKDLRILSEVLCHILIGFFMIMEGEKYFHKYSPIIFRTLERQGLDHENLITSYIKASNASTLSRVQLIKAIKLINKYKDAASPWEIIQENVIGSTAKFVWDTMCGKTSSQISIIELEKLQKYANSHQINDAKSMNHRQLCAKLANVTFNLTEECDLNDIDPWTMESMSEIPKERWYKIGKNCFDINSLNHAVEQGMTVNPFDRTLLDKHAIKTRYNLLHNTFRQNKIDAIRAVPTLSKEQYTSQLLATIWGKMKYPLPIPEFLKATENELNNVFESLKNYPVVPLTNQEIEKFRSSSSNRNTKLEIIIQILQRLFSLPENEMSTTLSTAIELSLNENIRVKRSRDDDESEERSSQQRRLSDNVGGRKKRKQSTRKSRKKSRR